MAQYDETGRVCDVSDRILLDCTEENPIRNVAKKIQSKTSQRLLPTQRKHQSPADAAETPVAEPADAEETPVAESAATQRSHKPEDILPVNAKPVYAALDKLSNTIADHAKGVLYSRLK
jgi:hypothetical protein